MRHASNEGNETGQIVRNFNWSSDRMSPTSLALLSLVFIINNLAMAYRVQIEGTAPLTMGEPRVRMGNGE